MNKDTIYMLETLHRAGISADDALALRRVAMTLHRWHELECGVDNGCVERDADDMYTCTQCGYYGFGQGNCAKCGDCAPLRHIATNKTFWRNSYNGKRYPTPDRETGALKRLRAIMARYHTLAAYVQGDPRGAALYILRPGDVPSGQDAGAYYSRGLAVYK